MSGIIGWTYEADMHCVDCSHKRFSMAVLNGEEHGEDSEGNVPHPIFSIEEGSEAGDYCGDCGAEINEPWPSYQWQGTGRTLTHCGKMLVTLSKVGNDSTGYNVSPTEADALSHKIAELLRENGQTLEEIHREYMKRS